MPIRIGAQEYSLPRWSGRFWEIFGLGWLQRQTCICDTTAAAASVVFLALRALAELSYQIAI